MSKRTSWKMSRIRKAGTIEQLKKKLWQGIVDAEEMIIKKDCHEKERCNAMYALCKLSSAYIDVHMYLDGDYEAQTNLKVPIPVDISKDYIETLLSNQLGIPKEDVSQIVPESVYQVKRLNLLMKRQTKNKKQTNEKHI